MLDRQPELAHRRGIIEPFCAQFRLEPGSGEYAGDVALQVRDMLDADGGEEHLVEPFSFLPSLLLFAALALMSFSRMVRGSSLFAIWGRYLEGG